MEERKNSKEYISILIPFLIMCFWPFPSKWIGYSMALYISDAILIGFLLICGIKNKYKIKNTNINKFLIVFFVLNIVATVIAIVKTNFWGIRQFAEIVRVIEWFVIYYYLYNTVKTISSHNMEKILYKCIFVIMIILSIFSIIELFNLPLKDIILKNMYEMGKSGNIFQGFNRISGTFKNPNMYGVFLSIISIILLISGMENKKKIPLCIVTLFFLYYTGSRTALIVTIMVYIITVVLKMIVEKNKKMLKQQLIIVGVIGLIIIIAFIFNNDLLHHTRFITIFQDMASLNGRTDIWQKYMEDISQNLIFGNGIIKNSNLIFDNVFIQYMYYYGITGELALIAFFMYNIIKSFKLYYNSKDIVALFCIVIQLIMIISGITIQILDVTQLTFIYFLSVAYIESRKDLKPKEENE